MLHSPLMHAILLTIRLYVYNYNNCSCYLFLSVCGNGSLLLQCVLQEATALEVAPTLAVLQVLQTFSQKNGFRKITNVK